MEDLEYTEESQQITWAIIWRFHFCNCAGECPLRDGEQNSYKETNKIFKLKTLFILCKCALGGDIYK